MKKFTADFETATWKSDETWVWAWATCEIGNEENLQIGTNIEEFIEYCKKEKNSKWYFHNLKFDGEFIIYWALKNGFTHVSKKEDIKDKTFTTIISDMGQFYQIELIFKKGNKKIHKATFIDSLKIIPFSVNEIAKSFDLPISKLEIDYKEERKKGHILTDEEKKYIKNDVKIVSLALNQIFKENLTKMTQGANALSDFRNILTQSKFQHYFPHLEYEIDKDIRKAYKGGFTYLNPIYKEKNVENGVVLDVNSLYPWVMYEKMLPFGEPIFYKGEYKNDNVYPLYIQMITCNFKIKKNKIPTIQIKNNKSFFRSNEYLESSKNEIVCLVLTNVDLKLFFEHYDVTELNYECGWKFKGISGIFKKYIDKWIARKNKATIEKNKGQRTLAKLMLNSLYGKFAKSMEVKSKIPYIGDDEIIHYKIYDDLEGLDEKEKKKKLDKRGLYIPIGCFITAYAREKTIRTSQAIKDYSIEKYGIDKYIYSDTDSIHCLLDIEEMKKFCDIDDIKLGAWKHESSFKRGKFIRQKCYIEEIDDEIKITCAGLPKNCYLQVEWDNFKTGFTCHRKINFYTCQGRSNFNRNRFYNYRRKNDKKH